jgi:hypothetical protein
MGYRYRESRVGLYDSTSATGTLPDGAIAVVKTPVTGQDIFNASQDSDSVTRSIDADTNKIEFEATASSQSIFDATQDSNTVKRSLDSETNKVQFNANLG